MTEIDRRDFSKDVDDDNDDDNYTMPHKIF